MRTQTNGSSSDLNPVLLPQPHKSYQPSHLAALLEIAFHTDPPGKEVSCVLGNSRTIDGVFVSGGFASGVSEKLSHQQSIFCLTNYCTTVCVGRDDPALVQFPS